MGRLFMPDHVPGPFRSHTEAVTGGGVYVRLLGRKNTKALGPSWAAAKYARAQGPLIQGAIATKGPLNDSGRSARRVTLAGTMDEG